MSADDDDITEELLADAGKLTGLSLELLGLDPHPDDMTPEQRLQFDPEDLAEMAAVSLGRPPKAVSQTRLLAGLLWNSSSILIDQLFRDLGTLSDLDVVTPADIAGTSVLSSLPPQFAASYDAKFTQKFIVVAADVTASLVRGWTAPGASQRNSPSAACSIRRKSLRTSTNWTFRRTGGPTLRKSCWRMRTVTALYSDNLDVLEDDAASWISSTGSSPSPPATRFRRTPTPEPYDWPTLAGGSDEPGQEVLREPPDSVPLGVDVVTGGVRVQGSLVAWRSSS